MKILKRDAVGRVSYSAGQREAILDEFERSGLKGAAFARMTGLQYQTFALWIQRRRHERGDYRMAATALKRSRRPVPVVRLLAANDPAVPTALQLSVAAPPRIMFSCTADETGIPKFCLEIR